MVALLPEQNTKIEMKLGRIGMGSEARAVNMLGRIETSLLG